MSEWKEYELEEVIEKFIDYRGKTPNKVKSGIPLVTAKIIKDGTILEPDEFIEKEEYKSWMRRGYPKKHDVLLTTEAPLGEVALIKNDNIALAQRVILLRGNSDILDNVFLFYSLRSRLMQHRLNARASGSTVQGIKSAELKRVSIPLPDYFEQKQIASVLSCLDQKIENLRKQNQTLEQIAQTLFKHWFIDFEFPNENGEPYKSSGGAMKPSELGEIPEGWRVGKLGDVTRLSTGKGLKKDDFNDNGYYPVLGANGEMGRTNNFLIEEQSILTGRVGTIGTVSINYVKAWISDNVIIINPDIILFYYIYFNLRKTNLKTLNRGSTQPLITQGDLKQIDVIIPNEKITKDFQEFCQMLFCKKRLNDKTIQTLTKTRDTLLPKLMSGKLRIQEGNIIEEGNETS